MAQIWHNEIFELPKTQQGCVAQSVAQLTLNQLVVGSNPTTPRFTIKEGLSPLFYWLILACFCPIGPHIGPR